MIIGRGNLDPGDQFFDKGGDRDADRGCPDRSGWPRSTLMLTIDFFCLVANSANIIIHFNISSESTGWKTRRERQHLMMFLRKKRKIQYFLKKQALLTQTLLTARGNQTVNTLALAHARSMTILRLTNIYPKDFYPRTFTRGNVCLNVISP